jgi:hypothetical protein
MLEKFSFMAGDDACALLPAMLQGVKSVVGQFGSVRMTENAENAAIMFGISLLVLHRAPLDYRKKKSPRNSEPKLSGRPGLENFTGNAGGAVSRLGHDCSRNPKIGVPEFFLELV